MIEKRVYVKDLSVLEITKRLSEGEIVFRNDEDQTFYKMYNGILTRHGKNTTILICPALMLDDEELYFVDTMSTVITKKGSYMTRDGRIAYVSLVLPEKNICHGAVEDLGKHCTWYLDGSAKSGGESDIDIVGELE